MAELQLLFVPPPKDFQFPRDSRRLGGWSRAETPPEAGRVGGISYRLHTWAAASPRPFWG